MFDTYRQALRAPGATAFYLAAAPARVGVAMTVLGMVWLVHGTTGSFAQAGLATGAFALTEAVIGPQTARFIDAFGQTRVVPLLLSAHGFKGEEIAETIGRSHGATRSMLLRARLRVRDELVAEDVR